MKMRELLKIAIEEIRWNRQHRYGQYPFMSYSVISRGGKERYQALSEILDWLERLLEVEP